MPLHYSNALHKPWGSPAPHTTSVTCIVVASVHNGVPLFYFAYPSPKVADIVAFWRINLLEVSQCGCVGERPTDMAVIMQLLGWPLPVGVVQSSG
ncbi:hypothetical protein GMOD_00008063 [Pyrenophora seminiperda CCB06]|uniref:Uncharacterized protein n=1 Tax=Pyrenophora seminiperda CCB06 TaxID=1302712 RepID=A0A3M7MGE4_9PLEO|nr:hypothetical protein GMOD_00008063 [Pyrenophora seminiperda CCB06]